MAISRLRQPLKEKIIKNQEAEKWQIAYLNQSALYFIDTARDARDTFSPYKSRFHLNRDLYQFFYGLGHIIGGVLIFGFNTLTALGLLILIPFKGKWALQQLGNALAMCSESLSKSIRGLTQMIFAPFGLMRILWRLPLTKQYQTFQERKSVQRLVGEIDGLVNDPEQENSTMGNLHVLVKALQRKVERNIDEKHAASIRLDQYPDHVTRRIYDPNTQKFSDTPVVILRELPINPNQVITDLGISVNSQQKINFTQNQSLRFQNYLGIFRTPQGTLFHKYSLNFCMTIPMQAKLSSLLVSIISQILRDERPDAIPDDLATDLRLTKKWSNTYHCQFHAAITDDKTGYKISYTTTSATTEGQNASSHEIGICLIPSQHVKAQEIASIINASAVQPTLSI